jgi:Sortase domain
VRVRLLPILAILTFIAGLAMLGFGYFYSGDTRAAAPAHVDYFTPTPTAPPPTLAATATDVPTPTPTPPPYNGAVARFKIPRFNVDASVEAISLKKGTNELDTPANPRDVGWYDSKMLANGPFLGDKPGFGSNALFSAHVDYYGLDPRLMPFNKLNQLSPDDVITVVMDNGKEYSYKVILKQTYNVSDIKMGELIDAAGRPRDKEWITLITCSNTGPFVYVSGGNSGPVEYQNRDVVIAERVS